MINPKQNNQTVTNGTSPSRIFEKTGLACTECGAIKNLSRHHLKNMRGKKTGVIKILCRRCHDDAEEEYRLLGIVQKQKTPITRNEKLELEYMNGKIPFYSTQPTERRERLG